MKKVAYYISYHTTDDKYWYIFIFKSRIYQIVLYELSDPKYVTAAPADVLAPSGAKP